MRIGSGSSTIRIRFSKPRATLHGMRLQDASTQLFRGLLVEKAEHGPGGAGGVLGDVRAGLRDGRRLLNRGGGEAVGREVDVMHVGRWSRGQRCRTELVQKGEVRLH